MADEKDSAPRTRPFTPPLPPFRGPATAARPPVNPLTAPEGRRSGLFVATRVPSKTVVGPAAPVIGIEELAPQASRAVTPVATPAIVRGAPRDEVSPPAAEAIAASVDPQRAEAVAATEAMPWLFADTGASQPVRLTVADAQGGEPFEIPGEDAAPEEAAQALTGLAYYDEAGASHQADEVADKKRSSGKVHRVDFDVAGVLESIAGQVRRGELDVPDIDPAAGDAAALATVLAALLRQRAR